MRKEYVKAEVLRRIENREAQDVDFIMKNGDRISVQPWINDTYEVWFSAIGEVRCAKNIDELVDWLMNHPAKQNEIQAAEDAWFAENEPKLKAYFKENFEGKSWEEIRDDEDLYDMWGWYSDWHKDVYGYRPHGIVCGVYINPHARAV